MKQDNYEQPDIPRRKRSMGDVRKLYAVPLSDGKTTVFIRDGRNREAVKKEWEKRLNIEP